MLNGNNYVGYWFQREEWDFNSESAVFHSAGIKQNGALTDFQFPAIFSSEFSVLPRKISENLQTDITSDANTRIIRTSHKSLNSNSLCMTFIFSSCNKHSFGLWYCPFQALKCFISHYNMGVTMAWNGLNRNVRKTIRYCKVVYATWRYDQKEPLLCLILHFLTSLSRFLFVKKKSRKSVTSSSGFSLKQQISVVRKSMESTRLSCRNYSLVVTTWIYYYARFMLTRFIPYSAIRRYCFFLFQVFCFCVFCRYRFGKLFLQYSCCLYVGFLISALS